MNLFISLFLSFHLFGGGEITSSGGEFITTEHNPWFVGEKPVSYCIKSSSNFSVGESTLKKVVKDSIEDWVGTLKAFETYPTYFSLPDGKEKNLSLVFNEETCQKDTELWFYFGDYNEDIKTILKTRSRYTAAFAGHKPIKDKNGRAEKAYIWLVPDKGLNQYLGPKKTPRFWSEPNTLKAVLIHEMGHMFGLRHFDDGVMNEGFPAFSITHGARDVTSRTLINHKWPNIDKKICNLQTPISDEVARNLLETNLVILWDICLESIKEGQYFSRIKLSFKTEPNKYENIEREFEFIIQSTMGTFFNSRRAIMGQYFVDKMGGPLDYRTHTFLTLESFQAFGRLVDEERSLAAFLRKTGSRIDLDFSVKENPYNLNFYFGNVKPTLEGIKIGIKQDVLKKKKFEN